MFSRNSPKKPKHIIYALFPSETKFSKYQTMAAIEEPSAVFEPDFLGDFNRKLPIGEYLVCFWAPFGEYLVCFWAPSANTTYQITLTTQDKIKTHTHTHTH